MAEKIRKYMKKMFSEKEGEGGIEPDLWILFGWNLVLKFTTGEGERGGYRILPVVTQISYSIFPTSKIPTVENSNKKKILQTIFLLHFSYN